MHVIRNRHGAQGSGRGMAAREVLDKQIFPVKRLCVRVNMRVFQLHKHTTHEGNTC